MDKLLSQLRQEGRLDSQGTLCVDWERGLRQLWKCQFELPGLYLLKLIQAAVALGARSIATELGATRVRFEAVLDLEPEDAEMAHISWGPFQTFRLEGLRHLAWALAATRVLPASRFELTLGGHRLSRTVGGWGTRRRTPSGRFILGHPGAVAVVTADDLETDLSQLQLAQDGRWETRLEEVRGLVVEFRASLAQSPTLRQHLQGRPGP